MALTDILQKIAADYAERAQKIIDHAIAEADNFAKQVQEDEQHKNEERWQKGLQMKSDALAKARTKMKISGQQKVLAAKRELIDETFSQVRERLSSLKENEYCSFLVPYLSKLQEQEGEIIAAKGKVDATQKALVQAKKSFKIKEGQHAGGFIFRAQNIEIDATFERLLADLETKYESEVAQILFG